MLNNSTSQLPAGRNIQFVKCLAHCLLVIALHNFTTGTVSMNCVVQHTISQSHYPGLLFFCQTATTCFNISSCLKIPVFQATRPYLSELANPRLFLHWSLDNWGFNSLKNKTKQEGPKGPRSLTWEKDQGSQWSQRTTNVVQQILVEDL